MAKSKIGIIVSSTRPGRFADIPVQWLGEIVRKRDDADFELVDLRDYPMPFFEEKRPLIYAPPENEVAIRWGAKMASLDGYIFVTPEYNHGIAAVLKNALDYAYSEYNRKPATFVGYGGAGGARAIEQLRLVLAELQVSQAYGPDRRSRDDWYCPPGQIYDRLSVPSRQRRANVERNRLVEQRPQSGAG